MLTARTPIQDGPTWSDWKGAVRVIVYRPYLISSVRIALIVGCILFAINHLDVVLRGQATRAVWMKGILTFLVPFCVSNTGILVASRRPLEPLSKSKPPVVP